MCVVVISTGCFVVLVLGVSCVVSFCVAIRRCAIYEGLLFFGFFGGLLMV